MKFKEYKGLDLAQTAADVLGEWDARDTFHKSITTREGHPAFVFYEGPPSANGTPGIHHVMARTIKDVFCRYKTQQGYLVHRKAGWDTHGLPVELGVEKKLGITKEDIGKKITIEEYNRTCREAVMEFTGMWEDLTRKMGYWVNMDDPYITYDNKYIETLWWLLKQLFDKGLLYKGYTIQPYSPAAGTGLSTHELNQPGCYRDVKDTTCTAQFEVIRDQKSEKLFAGVEGPLYFLAWTTTPWTLPSNTALAVGPAIEYVKIKCRNPYTDRPQTVILAKELVPAYFTKKMEGTYEITGESWRGPELEGIRYEQLIPWVKPMGDAFRVIVGDYVTTSDGTGIVHIAPTFGADDDRVGRAAGIAPLFMVDKAGKNQPMVDRQGKFFLLEDLDPEFVKNNVDAEKYREYAGRYVKNAYDPNIAPDAETTLDIDIDGGTVRLPLTTLTDGEGNKATLEAQADISNTSNIAYSARLIPSNIMAIDTKARVNDQFYGKVYISGAVNVKGNRNGINVDVAVTTQPGSAFYLPLSNKSNMSEADWIVFESRQPENAAPENVLELKKQLYERSMTERTKRKEKVNLNLNVSLNVNPGLLLSIIIDPATNMTVNARGTAALNVLLNPGTGELSIFGTYEIAEGDFLFSMPFIHPALIFRREALEAAGGYSTLPRCDRCEDYDLLLRLYEMGYSGANMQEFLFRYSLPHNGISTRTLRDRTNEVRTRWARFSALGLLPKALPYALKPWAVWLVPRNTLRRLKEKRAAKSGDKL